MVNETTTFQVDKSLKILYKSSVIKPPSEKGSSNELLRSVALETISHVQIPDGYEFIPRIAGQRAGALFFGALARMVLARQNIFSALKSDQWNLTWATRAEMTYLFIKNGQFFLQNIIASTVESFRDSLSLVNILSMELKQLSSKIDVQATLR